TKLTGVGTGWGVLGPTFSIINAYESGDQRRKATIMLPGDYYPDILEAKGGYTVPSDVNAVGTNSAIKKHVIGTPKDNNGQGVSQARTNQPYLLRYADVLLTNAEAALKKPSPDKHEAVQSINKVRERAGLGDLNTSTISVDAVLHERRVEFAFESKYWYVLKRIDRNKADQLIQNQDRGAYY